MAKRNRAVASVVAVVITVGVGASAGAADDDGAADIVADQVRDQGWPCADPVQAVRDPAESRPDEAVWTLQCADAVYRVRLVPDEAAEIKVLGD
jgi:hypothetical protein